MTNNGWNAIKLKQAQPNVQHAGQQTWDIISQVSVNPRKKLKRIVLKMGLYFAGTDNFSVMLLTTINKDLILFNKTFKKRS